MKRYLYNSIKKSLLTIAFVVLFIGVSWGQVTLPHLDPINYTIGQSLDVQTTWTSLNSGDALLISSGNLSYSGLVASSGNKVTFDGAGIDAAKLFTQQTTGIIYYSFLLNITALGSLNATGSYFTGFTEGATTTFGGTVWTRSDGAGFDIGINPRTTATNTVWSGIQTINNTLFIVISYQIVAGTTNDIVKLWINPTPGSAEPAATLTATNTLTDLANLNRILIRQDASTTTPFIEMDELRIGTTWADVTPAGTTPTITVSPSTLSGFTYFVGSGPSASQSYSLSGTNLTGFPGNITVTGSANYEVSTDNATFSGSVNVAYGSATLNATTIYVRLKTGLSVGNYNSETISNAGGGATTQNVTCSGTVTASAATDFISANGESATISSLINNVGPLTSVQGTQVWQFLIRDGGAGLNDADNLSSIVTAITFSQAGGNSVGTWNTAIQAIDLFDGVTNIGSGTVTANQVQFTGLNINVADNTQKTISVRLTLKCPLGAGILDGEDFGFQISNVNVTLSASGSGKTAFVATTSLNSQDAISIVATQLLFSQQPTSTGTNQNMAPSVTVYATDVCGNIDIGFSGSVSITSTGTLTGSPVSSSAVTGVATFASLSHSAIGAGLILTATSTGLSLATSSTFNINFATTFGTGDIAIVGMCVNMGLCGGVGGEDEISFVSFEDIAPGTTIDLTDNGFERVGCGSSSWGNTEGVVRITRNTSTIPKGTVITLRISDQSVFTPLQPDANWTVTYPNSGFGLFNLNNNDEQVYIMNGGTWNKGTINTHDATYTGGILMFGINTYTSWTCNDNLTTRGNLPLALRCYSILPGIVAVNLKYTGPTTAASQKDWIDRLNSSGNWSGSANCATYITQGLDYAGTSQTYTISAGGFSAGMWTGATSTDWFDCNNWQNYKVPTITTDVTIRNQANDPTIGASPALYPNGAESNDITIDAVGPAILTINDNLSVLSVYGNIYNNGTFTHTNGVFNIRNGNSTLSSTSPMAFYNLTLNKTANNNTFTTGNDITVSNTLTLTSGILTTGSNKVLVSNTAIGSIAGYGSNSFINGILRRNVLSTGSYNFPVGTSTNYELGNINLNSSIGLTYIEARFTNPHSTPIDITSLGLTIGTPATPVTTLLDYGFWTIAPDAGTFNYDVTITSNGHSNGGAIATQHTIVKRANSGVNWATYDSNHNNATQSGTGASPITAKLSGLTSFSDFAIARSATFPLPVELTMFTGKSLDKQILLLWQTSSETNNDYFEVFKSKDLKYFEKLGTLSGAGNSNSALSYSFIDETPFNRNNFYKLIQFDFDGKSTESETILIQFNNSGELNIYVNGVNNIIISNCINKIDFVEINDISGKTIYTKNIISEENQIQINICNISPGIYFVKVISNNETTVRKVFIK